MFRKGLRHKGNLPQISVPTSCYFCGYILRQEKLEHVVTAGKIYEKKKLKEGNYRIILPAICNGTGGRQHPN